jgi:hypothetical protein
MKKVSVSGDVEREQADAFGRAERQGSCERNGPIKWEIAENRWNLRDRLMAIAGNLQTTAHIRIYRPQYRAARK